ncbi:hypothetical protein [Cupriavidus sp. TA19]|nr:hypothetical protein [Cupriavidus sp. TA19]
METAAEIVAKKLFAAIGPPRMEPLALVRAAPFLIRHAAAFRERSF